MFVKEKYAARKARSERVHWWHQCHLSENWTSRHRTDRPHSAASPSPAPIPQSRDSDPSWKKTHSSISIISYVGETITSRFSDWRQIWQSTCDWQVEGSVTLDETEEGSVDWVDWEKGAAAPSWLLENIIVASQSKPQERERANRNRDSEEREREKWERDCDCAANFPWISRLFLQENSCSGSVRPFINPDIYPNRLNRS